MAGGHLYGRGLSMPMQTTNEKGRPAGNEATHMQTGGDFAPSWPSQQAPRASLDDAPCLCSYSAGGRCQTCRRWVLAFRQVQARRGTAARRGKR